MDLGNGGMSPADFAAVMGNGGRGYGGGFGNGFGDGAWWIIILFLFAMNATATVAVISAAAVILTPSTRSPIFSAASTSRAS